MVHLVFRVPPIANVTISNTSMGNDYTLETTIIKYPLNNKGGCGK